MSALCRHFGPCGGCQRQDVPYAEQLTAKRARLRDLLVGTLGSGAPAVEPVIGMPLDADGPWGFRHKASFVFGLDPHSRRGLVMGHYEAGSRRIVPIIECPVHASRANRIAFALRDRLAHAGIPPAGPALDGVLRHVVVRTTRDEREAVAMLVVTRNDRRLRAPVRALLDSEDRPDGFYVSVHTRPDAFMVGADTLHLAGLTHVRERCGGASFLVSPTAFFQTNPIAADALVRLVLEEAGTPGADSPILDLYAGSGLFAIPLSLEGRRVTAVEESHQAVKDGKANERLNRVPAGRLRWIAGRVEDLRDRLGRPALVVLDPPRQGCAPRVIEAVFREVAPARAVYVSCNPEALASELPAIVSAGYRIARVQPVDMFPHTDHVECVVTLQRSTR